MPGSLLPLSQLSLLAVHPGPFDATVGVSVTLVLESGFSELIVISTDSFQSRPSQDGEDDKGNEAEPRQAIPDAFNFHISSNTALFDSKDYPHIPKRYRTGRPP